ncbi:MAG: hypothetical protein QOE09_1943 [Ilumatobacteraceae bacterium]|jgi:hypothetical protein
MRLLRGAVRLERDDVEVLRRGADGDPAEAVRRDVVRTSWPSASR